MEITKDNILKLFTKKNLLFILTFFMLFFVQFTIMLVNYLVKYGHMKSVTSINMSTPILICLPFLLGIYIYDLFKSKRKINRYDYIFYALVVSGALATIFATDPEVALMGSKYRNSGFLVAVSCYLLCINWKENGTQKDIKKIISMIFFVTFLNAVYGILQVYTNYNFILRFINDNKMASGFCGHPNFFGTLMVTSLSFLLYYLLTEKITLTRLFLFVLFLISLINSQSTGPIVTFIVIVIFLIIFLLIKKIISLKKFIVLVVLLALVPGIYLATLFVNKTVFNNNRCELCQIEKTIKNGGTGRVEIWVNSLKVVKEYWLIGVGYDNLYLTYPTIGPNGRLVDNAHNIYLHELVITGILGFIPYMAFILIAFKKGIKSKNRHILLLFTGFLAYLIQGLANLNVIQVMPMFFVIMGLLLCDNENKKALE